jgi:spermidine synthase
MASHIWNARTDSMCSAVTFRGGGDIVARALIGRAVDEALKIFVNSIFKLKLTRLIVHVPEATMRTVRSNLSEMPRSSWFRYCTIIALVTFVLIREWRPYVSPVGDPNSMRSPNSLVERDEETGFSQSLDVLSNSPIFTKRSKYQTIEVHESHHFGKILKLDGVTQLTEKDADSYNEMMAHVPLFQHAHPIRVLVIGGGDGYVVNEVLKHASVERVDHVELDIDVIQTCQKYFSWGHVWDDPRVHLHIVDGATFVQDAPTGSFDVIIQDSSDPWTWDANGKPQQLPSSVLYSTKHFASIHRILAEDGVLNFQVLFDFQFQYTVHQVRCCCYYLFLLSSPHAIFSMRSLSRFSFVT